MQPGHIGGKPVIIDHCRGPHQSSGKAETRRHCDPQRYRRNALAARQGT